VAATNANLSGARLTSAVKVILLVLAIGFVPLAVGGFLLQRQSARQDRARVDRSLANSTAVEAEKLESYFERARSIMLLTAHNPVFARFYSIPGDREAKIRSHPRLMAQTNAGLAYLEHLYPAAIGEACFIDRAGPEIARIVYGKRAAIADLSLDESKNPFFGPTFALPFGAVYQARPYVSPDTGEWVISNSTPMPTPDGVKRAIVHFEVRIESFRRAAATNTRYPILVVEGRTGAVVFDSRLAQRKGAPLGRPGDRRFGVLATRGAREGVLSIGDKRVSYRRLANGRGNANDWYVVALAKPGGGVGLVRLAAPVAGMALALLLIGLAMARRWVRTNRELEHLALHDALTGLPNRRLFSDRLERALSMAKRQLEPLALMVVDLDRFKEVNDTLGHEAGDQLLRAIVPRLESAVRDSDTVARLGGDEFGILLPRVTERDAVATVAERLRSSLEHPLSIEGTVLTIEASIGTALFPDHGQDPQTLMQAADLAMYSAKKAHSGHRVYSDVHDRPSVSRLSIIGGLRNAIEQGELELHYQPKASLESGDVSGVEALVRWRHPERGLVYPDDFIPIAQQTGLLRSLTLFVLEEALRQRRDWSREGLELTMAVNLSPGNLLDANFSEDVSGLLRRYDVPPNCLVLEITESAMLLDPTRALEVAIELESLGVKLSIDDFGTGYSSLAHLRRLPVEELKIDKSFVLTIAEDEDNRAIVRSTIDLARSLGLRSVAEGVETEQAWELLRSFGCELAQGYHLTRPLPADELVRWLGAARQRGDQILIPG
jgi:diguanylate cyclase (GGDEF)-like protein